MTTLPRRLRLDAAVRRAHHLDSTLDIVQGSDDPALLGRIQNLRTDYQRALGWLGDERHDQDILDNHPATLHLAKWQRDRGDLLTTMRMSPVGSWLDTVAMSRLELDSDLASSGYSALTRLFGPEPSDTWELSRLAHPLFGVRPHQVLDGLAELVGVAVEATAASRSTAWVFLATPELRDALAMVGVSSVDLVHGRVCGRDRFDSVLSLAYPVRGLAAAAGDRRFDRALDHVARGRAFMRGVAVAGSRQSVAPARSLATV